MEKLSGFLHIDEQVNATRFTVNSEEIIFKGIAQAQYFRHRQNLDIAGKRDSNNMFHAYVVYDPMNDEYFHSKTDWAAIIIPIVFIFFIAREFINVDDDYPALIFIAVFLLIIGKHAFSSIQRFWNISLAMRLLKKEADRR